MDSKITLAFDETIINKAKEYADQNNISLSRLVEFLLDKITTGRYASLEDFPISGWVNMVADGKVEYKATPKKRKQLRDEYHQRKK